nr:adenosylcobinamide-GDP ribazoletransferase [Motiliproteus sediminis]
MLAFQFLTRIPMPDTGVLDNRTLGRSLLWYPLVGATIGALLWLAQALLAGVLPQWPWVQGALLLLLWVVLTGGLHLDGLADSADAWAGGLGDRERTLALMKDPTCGPSAVVWLVLVLLLKAALLSAVVASAAGWLVLVPMLARSAIPLLFMTTPYVRPGGLGEVLAAELPRRELRHLLLLVVVLTLLLGSPAWLALLAGAGAFLGLRALMCRRIGGTTGDTAGAMVELLEVTLLAGLLIGLH